MRSSTASSLLFRRTRLACFRPSGRRGFLSRKPYVMPLGLVLIVRRLRILCQYLYCCTAESFKIKGVRKIDRDFVVVPICLPYGPRATVSLPQMDSTILKTRYWSSATRWRMRRMLHMRARSATRCSGRSFRLPTSVSITMFINTPTWRMWTLIFNWHSATCLGSRYIYELYYEKEAITRQLYDWLLKNNYADANLIAKWKKQGYEKVGLCALDAMLLLTKAVQLCCLKCIQTKETNFNATCICRVPQAQLKEDQMIECVSCGCRGCSSADWIWKNSLWSMSKRSGTTHTDSSVSGLLVLSPNHWRKHYGRQVTGRGAGWAFKSGCGFSVRVSEVPSSEAIIRAVVFLQNCVRYQPTSGSPSVLLCHVPAYQAVSQIWAACHSSLGEDGIS